MILLYTFFFLLFSIALSFYKNKDYISILVFYIVSLIIIFFIKIARVRSLIRRSNQIFPFFSDYTSFLLVGLSLLVILYSFLARLKHINKKSIIIYFFLLMVIVLSLAIFFFIRNLLILFILFEFVLLPIVFIIVIWGSQGERLLANYYFFLYTILRGFPLLLIILFSTISRNRNFFCHSLKIVNSVNFLFFFCFLIAFFCKIPIYGFHIWLPKAHVEAPIRGSIVLARLLLKIRGYRVLRFISVIFVSTSLFIYLFISFLIIRIIFPILICFRQSDIKSLVAYSSVSHICAAVLGLLIYRIYRRLRAFLIFLGHGFISPGIFYLRNLIYERLGSRLILGLRGKEKISKSFTFIFIFFFIANIRFPPFISFFGELCIYYNLMLNSIYLRFFFFFFIIFSRIVIFLYISKILKRNNNRFIFLKFTKREIFIAFSIIFWVLIITFLLPFL